jgi:drug/metabolite transporter (DMT)-like permease
VVPARDGVATALSGARAALARAPAPLLIAGASLLFALMGLCVKLASAQYDAAEIVLYRGLVGMAWMALIVKARGDSLRTRVPALHFWRSASGVLALALWFYALGRLPLATAMTLNYTSSLWLAALLVGASVLRPGRGRAVDSRLLLAVLAGFAGVAMILRPTLAQRQLGDGLIGLVSGLFAALAYLKVTELGRAGEPETRVVFYFSAGGVVAGALFTLVAGGGPGPHDARGLALLLAIGTLASAAQLMMTRAYSIGRTLSNAALQYLGIVFSFGLGVWLFGDKLTASAVAGMLLIVAAGLSATRASVRAPIPIPPTGGRP